MFLCCHPALAVEAQAALTLRLVRGMTTQEVARAFLVPEATTAARTTRARRKIAAARIPFAVPRASQLPERLDGVLTVVHLLFSAGHTAPAGPELVRVDLLTRLGRTAEADAAHRRALELSDNDVESRHLRARLGGPA